MNNIPENIIKAVADAPTLDERLVIGAGWPHQSSDRRAVIQHALDNPALAPFLAGGIGEYTDEEIKAAWTGTVLWSGEARSFEDRLRAFLSALPRRESPALAEAKAELEQKCTELTAAVNRIGVEHTELKVQQERAEKAEAELAALKAAQLGILRPIAEMPETVPDGCFMVSGWQASGKYWMMNGAKHREDTHFAFLRLPAAEATPPAEPEPAAQVPLGPEDVPPGSVFRHYQWKAHSFRYPKEVNEYGVHWTGDGTTHSQPHNTHQFELLMKQHWQINTSIPDTGRWDANAWRDCSKPAGKEAAK